MLSRFIKGWVNYFKLADMKGKLEQVDEWLRRRIRAILLETVEEGQDKVPNDSAIQIA